MSPDDLRGALPWLLTLVVVLFVVWLMA